MVDSNLYPYFLGPYGENDDLLIKLYTDFLRDHVYWRRNVHPEDPPAIPTRAAQQPEFLAFEARLRRELHALSASLKRSVPFHSPRYLGHMVSDLLLPGLAALMLAMPYNPNNVSEEAAPVTIDMEIRAGLQLAQMLGYPTDPSRPDCAFGYLTSGGTLANYQALRLALALKAFPLALRAAAPAALDLPPDDWTAFNLTPAESVSLLDSWYRWTSKLTPAERRYWRDRVNAERIEHLGHVAFFARHPQVRPPVVLAPVTAHYSWSKAVKLLGLGREQLILLPERGMRLDLGGLESALQSLRASGRSVLEAVGVSGTTEFGTIDPIDGILALRDRHAREGYGFAVHVDAAWGGYLATLFRESDGRLRPFADVRREFDVFPSEATYAAVSALGGADSITVDPHKLGYLPYGTGAFVCRDHRGMALLAEEADYVFSDSDEGDYFAHFRKLGRYILEGSKSGAAAAAVYVTHRVLPLEHAHFGRLVRQTILSAEAFTVRAARFAEEMRGVLNVCIPYPPDSNLVCLALNPAGNRDVAVMNLFVRGLHGELRGHPEQPLPTREFLNSVTSLRPQSLGEADTRQVLDMLGLDPSTLRDDNDRADRLMILRHTLMNPFLIDTENEISYIDRYFEFLARHARSVLSRPLSAAAV